MTFGGYVYSHIFISDRPQDVIHSPTAHIQFCGYGFDLPAASVIQIKYSAFTVCQPARRTDLLQLFNAVVIFHFLHTFQEWAARAYWSITRAILLTGPSSRCVCQSTFFRPNLATVRTSTDAICALVIGSSGANLPPPMPVIKPASVTASMAASAQCPSVSM